MIRALPEHPDIIGTYLVTLLAAQCKACKQRTTSWATSDTAGVAVGWERRRLSMTAAIALAFQRWQS